MAEFPVRLPELYHRLGKILIKFTLCEILTISAIEMLKKSQFYCNYQIYDFLIFLCYYYYNIYILLLNVIVLSKLKRF